MAANRDEFYKRPSIGLACWRENTAVIGGRDLRGGGSWLAARAGGRLGAVTNVRKGGSGPGVRSRGLLVRDFVLGEALAASFSEATLADWEQYGGFNLLVHDGKELVWATNRPTPEWKSVKPGIHALSNGAPSFVAAQKPWPKVALSIRALDQWTRTIPASGYPDLSSLFALLSNEQTVEDELLPDTGIGLERERMLAPPFVRSGDYGTRASTVVLVSSGGEVVMVERRFNTDGLPNGEARMTLPPRHRSPQPQPPVHG